MTQQFNLVLSSINKTPNDPNLLPQDVNEKVNKFFTQEIKSELGCQENDSFSKILFLFTIWMKINCNHLSIEAGAPGQFKIKIDNANGQDQLAYISTLFY